MNTKLSDSVIFLATFLTLISSIIYFSVELKFYEDNFLRTNKWSYKDETIIYYFIYSGIRKVFRKIMQQNYGV